MPGLTARSRAQEGQARPRTSQSGRRSGSSSPLLRSPQHTHNPPATTAPTTPPTAPGTKTPMPDTHAAAAVPSCGGLCRLWCLAEAGLAPVLPHPSRGRAAPAKASAFAHFTFWATFSNAPPERRAGGGEGGNDKQRPVGSCLCVPTARLLQSWSATDQCGAPAKTARHLGTTGPLCPAWDWTSLPGKPQPRAHGIAEDSSA